MASSELLYHATYNDLPNIEDQSILSDVDLVPLGSIFQKYGVCDEFGISLLHKHFNLDDGEVMLHEGLRCSPYSPGSTDELEGKAFFLHDGQFKAFEYERSRVHPIDPIFLQEIQTYLLSNGLERRMALSRLDREYPNLMEHCESGRSQVCEETREAIMTEEATEWRFDGLEDSAIPVIVRGCARTSSGDHKPK